MTTRTNLTIHQGETYTQVFTWQDASGVGIDLSSYTAHMQVRRNYADIDNTDPILDLVDEIELDEDGNIVITLTDDVTEAMPAGDYVYDLELTNNGTVTKLLSGKVSVIPEVTR